MKGIMQSIVGGMIGVMIAAIVGGLIVIPILANISAENTGMAGTILGYGGVLIAIVIIVLIVGFIRM
jgi:hypothetical protein